LEGLSGTAIRILIVAVAALFVLRLSMPFVRRLVARRLERQQDAHDTDQLGREDVQRRVATVTSLVEWVLRIVVIVAATVVLLLAFDLTPVILGILVVLAAIGFAAQEVIRDYVAGLLIMLENQFGIGDYVTIAGQTGEVESFSLRRSVLRSDDGDLISVPNGEIRVARNLTRIWARVNLELPIADPARITDAVGAIDAAGRSLMADPAFAGAMLELPVHLGVARFDDMGVVLLVRGRIRASDRLRTTGEYRRRVLDALLEAGLAPSMSRRVTLETRSSGTGDAGGWPTRGV
jgi:small conductance mechanosensitive channel